MSTTLTPTSISTSAPNLTKNDWIIAGCVLLLFGFFVFIYASLKIYKISKKNMSINIALWIGMICIAVGGVLLKHTTEVV